MAAENIEERLVSYLADAHSLEQNALAQLRTGAETDSPCTYTCSTRALIVGEWLMCIGSQPGNTRRTTSRARWAAPSGWPAQATVLTVCLEAS